MMTINAILALSLYEIKGMKNDDAIYSRLSMLSLFI